MLWPSRPDWPARIVPLVVNVLQHPLPTPRRCYKLGQAIRQGGRVVPQDLKVAMVGTGGLSHQMIGERTGYNDEAWDREFLALDRGTQSARSCAMSDFVRRGGAESVEEIMWLGMRGALRKEARKTIHDSTSTCR